MLSSIFVLPLLWTAPAFAQNIIPTLSFGTKGTISQNSFSIPGWTITGDNYKPQLLSDKVILTPPYGGGKRGSLWAENRNTQVNWETSFEFRAGGSEHARGSLIMWYVKEGSTAANIYTVGKFDGLALVIDQNNGQQKIRGFLNDGNTDYKTHTNVDSLPFGHCDHNYRNLGRPIKVLVKSTVAGLQVTVDDKPCFATTKVALPTSYLFGVTAASADPPDSFEIFKFQVSTTAAGTVPQSDDTHKSSSSGQGKNTGKQVTSPGSTSDSAIEQLNQRLAQLEKSVTDVLTQINKRTTSEEAVINEILQLLKSGQTANAAGAGAAIGNLESRLSSLDRTISSLSGELKTTLNHDEKFAKLSQQLSDTHEGLTHHLPITIRQYVQDHTPRIGFIVFSFMAFQSCCLGFLLWQKYRKSNMPKKFL